jgi:NDP-sugar pyrophosphorylase family protein
VDAIILAGGKGTRMRPLTDHTPKPLLDVQGRPILEWSLIGLRPVTDHALIVVNYLKEQIARFMSQQTIFDHYTLVEQLPEPLGTGHALMSCQPYLRSEAFLAQNGDDFYAARSIAALAQTKYGIMTLLTEDQVRWAVVVTNQDGYVARLHEKPPEGTYPTPVQASIGAYKLDVSIFEYDLPLSPRGEYELPDYINWLAQHQSVETVNADFWFPIGTPDDLAAAQLLDLRATMFA